MEVETQFLGDFKFCSENNAFLGVFQFCLKYLKYVNYLFL